MTPVRIRVAPARLSWRPCPCFAPILDPPQAVALRDSRSNLEEGGGDRKCRCRDNPAKGVRSLVVPVDIARLVLSLGSILLVRSPPSPARGARLSLCLRLGSDSLAVGLVGRPVGWLVGCLIGWSVGRLIG